MSITLERAVAWLAAACLASAAAFAAETPGDAHKARPHEAAPLCDHCGRVTAVTTEQRKGKASGLGAVGGAVAGGVLGHQIGGGSGRTVTTVGGAAAGGLLGNELEKRMKKHTVWVTHVTMHDGTKRTFEAEANPGLRVGDVVSVDNGQMRKHVATIAH